MTHSDQHLETHPAAAGTNGATVAARLGRHAWLLVILLVLGSAAVPYVIAALMVLGRLK